MKVKLCARCQHRRPVALFCRDRRRPDGRSPYCRACRMAVLRRWRRENPDQYRTYNRERMRRYRAARRTA